MNNMKPITERAADVAFVSGYVLLMNHHCHQPGVLVPYALLFSAIAVRFIMLGRSEA